MSVRANPQLIRLALGCIQPADSDSIGYFIGQALVNGDGVIPPKVIQKLLSHWEDLGDVACVHKHLHLYSLTRQGDGKLTPKERRVRDRTRLFLLKDARLGARLKKPEAGHTEKADASSAVSNDHAIQEEERPIVPSVSPRRARRTGRDYWPLLAKQLLVGSSAHASGPRFRFLSYQTEKACAKANNQDAVSPNGVSIGEISLALGISPRLIGALLHQPEKHYRTFEIPKANGKVRQIQSPRTMMKVVQYFLLDYILFRLPVHPSATAYSEGCSVKANATVHVGQKYVANIDVSDFFPSLNIRTVFGQLLEAGLKINTAFLVARVCSYKGGLPQGAPTSAALSNIVLFGFDEKLTDICEAIGVRYTRYADDITFSGDNITLIKSVISKAREELARLNLKINDGKTRIFGPSSRKVVTGVVVNVWPQPSRRERRNLRAALHQAKTHPGSYVDRLHELQGRAAYMLSYASEDRPVGGLSSNYVRMALNSLRVYLSESK